MKITKHEVNGDISIEFKKFIVWFYPHRHMNISHMKPKTLIKGFLFKSDSFGTSYMMDFYFFKISWSRVQKLQTQQYGKSKSVSGDRPRL